MKSRISEERFERLRARYKQGTRIELISTSDPYTRTKPGDRGTVICVDTQGTIIVAWDNETSLNVIPGEDVVRKL